MTSDNLYQEAIEYYSQLARSDPKKCFYHLWHDGYTWSGRALLVPLNIIGGLVMVRGKASNPQPEKVKATWNTTFVDISMAGHSLDDVSAAFPTVENVYETVAGLLENGYRLGFSYNPQNDAFICSVTCKSEGNPNMGKTFTAFAGTWFEAVQVALYKHYVVSETIWGTGGQGEGKARFG